MTVDELLGRISSRELTEWMAFAHLEAEDRRLAELEAKALDGVRRR